MSTFRFRFLPEVPPLNVAEWRHLAQRKLPDFAWNYLEGGAEDMLTLRENMSRFRHWHLRQRVLVGKVDPDIKTVMMGTPVSMPVALAPLGACGLAHWSGEIAAARAAEASGTRAAISTAASYRLEEVSEATEQDHWFQLYPIGTREEIGELVDRVQTAGYTALIVTVDVQTLGNREGERRLNFQLPWTVTPDRALHLIKRWRWVSHALKYNRIAAIHYVEMARQKTKDAGTASGKAVSGIADAVASKEQLISLLKGDFNWEDLTWLRERWKGRLYLKGILDADDAAKAVDVIGAEGVIVSNHGGRQLDHCLASIDALPAVVDRIGDRAEVYLDGGVRRGTDVLVALCLGAKGVFIGRPYIYGLAAGGQDGVSSILQIFNDEIKRALILMGCPSVAQLNRSWLTAPYEV